MKKHIAAAAVCLLLSAAAAFGLAEFTGTHAFNNTFGTAGVDVKIEHLRPGANGLVSLENGISVLPGETADYIPRVTNLEEDSYVRVSFNIDPENFEEINNDWIRRGQYFYCTRVMGREDRSDVLRKVRVPDDAATGGRFTVRATVDAIQAVNFTPDFNSIAPWGSVKIEERPDYLRSTRDIMRTVSAEGSPDFTYMEEGTFECSTNDLFADFARFRPGDSAENMLKMRNSSRKAMDIYFRTENSDTEILREMKLSISCCGREVYRGNLMSDELSRYMKIGTVEAGDCGNLEFAIELPAEAGNRFEQLTDSVKWIIAVREKDSQADRLTVAATGDRSPAPAIAFAGALLALLTAVAVFVTASRRNRKS